MSRSHSEHNAPAESFNFVPRVVQLFFLVALLANSLAVCCEVYARHLHYPWPYTSPMLNDDTVPDPRVPDLLNFVPSFRHLHTPDFFSDSLPVPYMYPAPVAPLYGLFLAPYHRVPIYEGCILLIAIGATALLGVQLRRRGLSVARSTAIPASLFFLSYPMLFEWKQGNMEIFVCVLVGIGVWCFLRNHLHMAAVCIGIAGAMKIFPLVYLGLFLARRRYTPLLTAVIAAAAVSVLSLLYLDPSLLVSFRGIQHGLAFYRLTVALQVRREIGFDHSLFGALKVAHYGHYIMPNPHHLGPMLTLYLGIAAAAGVALFLLRIRKLPVTNQVLSLCVASILLPPVSYDYTLLHLYIPLAMLLLLAFQNGNRKMPGLAAVFVCLALATSIETEFIRRALTYGGQVKALVLLALFVVALWYPLQARDEVPGLTA